jgi:abequosyltransferase
MNKFIMKKANEENILLSICIPTFNRVEYLPCLLDSIVEQHNNNFEICISDNASSDGTKECVQEYQKSYSFINYARNNKNLGFDRNILKVVSMAKGKYVWIIGDDDKIFNNEIIGTIYKKLQDNNSLDFLLFDKQLCDINMNAITTRTNVKALGGINKTYHIKSQNDIIDFFKNCEYLGNALGFISGFIFKKKRWDETKDDFSTYPGFIHLTKAWSILSASATIYYFDNKFISVRTGNDNIVMKSNYCFRAAIDFYRISSYTKAIWPDCDKILDATMKLVKNELDSVYKNFKNCVGMRAFSTQKDWVYFYTTYKSRFGIEFPYTFINLLPNFIFNILHYLVKKLKLVDEKFIVQSRKEMEKDTTFSCLDS